MPSSMKNATGANCVTGFHPGRLNEKLKDLYGRLCEVLHARKAVVSKDAREVFLETLLVIEKLYESHGL